MMATVYGVLRSLQRQQREASILLLRLIPNRTSSHVNTTVSFSQLSRNLNEHRRAECFVLSRNMNTDNTSQQQPSPLNNKQDNVVVDIGPGTWKEIYHGILSTQIKMVKFFSLSTSMMGVGMQPILLPKVLGSNAGAIVFVASFVGFFTFATPFLIHWVTKKYVTSLEYDPQKDIYSATTLSFFLTNKKITFTVDDVKVPEVPGMFTTFIVKDRPLFVDPRMFKDMEHYGRLMGYDKPLNLHLGDENEKID